MMKPVKARFAGLGLKQVEAAKTLKITEYKMSRIVNGHYSPDKDLCRRIAKLLRCPQKSLWP